jgi:hypothetical protein
MKSALIAILFVLCCPLSISSFALLAHEAIIDASWEKYIKPLLQYKFPLTTEEELKKARAFAYGGAVMPDIGYYPLGSQEFSNLVHYIRSGDFVNALLDDSKNIQEYAFALGVLCHYEADSFGHSLGTNKAVPILFSKLRKRYGEDLTYEQDRYRHARVEFGFDVLQTARGHYKSNAYHDFIGFEVNVPILERAFLKTYGINLKDVFRNLNAAISALRYSAKVIIPELTKNAWEIKNSVITKSNPLVTEGNYRYQMSNNNYRKEFTHPGMRSVFISIVIGVLPKYRPLSRLKPKIPSPEVEKLFVESFDAALAHYSATLNKLYSVDCGSNNVNLDTGKKTVISEYMLADKAYFQLLMKLKQNEFVYTNKRLKKNLVDYYNLHGAAENKTQLHKNKLVAHALAQLNSITSISRSSN